MAAASRSDSTADMVLRNGRIYTVDPANPWADALAVRAGVSVEAEGVCPRVTSAAVGSSASDGRSSSDCT